MSSYRATGRIGLLLGSFCALSAFATAQNPQVLTLAEALRMARERNGTIIAAQYDVAASKQRVVQSNATLWPTITPTYRYNSSRQQFRTTGGSAFVQDEGGASSINASWRILDSGVRNDTIKASKSSYAAQQFTARQTLRSTLFVAAEDYYEALRSQELLRVAEQQVLRTSEILDQVKARIEVKDVAAIEELQADVDYQNARVQALVARNKVSTSSALLKSTIGLDADQPLPPLEPVKEAGAVMPPDDLAALTKEGLANRPDLLARRRGLQALGYNRDRARREAGLTFGLDATFDQQLTPKSLENRVLSLTVSYPLFDAGASRAAAREMEENIRAEIALLTQAERVARSEIEAAYFAYSQNADRMRASDIALKAARKNYEAAVESKRLAAYDLLQVTTAQTSLVTAESAYIEAIYDYRISEARLRLSTGRPVPGEQP